MIDELMYGAGATCELRSEKNDLIFVGRIQRSDGETLTVAEALGGMVPPVIYNTQVKLIVRGVRRDPTAPLVLTGQICGSSRTVWKIDRLIRFQYSEHREAYRQKVNCAGRVLCMNSIFRPNDSGEATRYEAVPCRLVDISMTGVLFGSKSAYEREDWVVLLDVTLVEGQEPFVLTCQICRLESLGGKEMGYGCRFTHMTERERDRLCRSIFDIQRQELQERRKGR